MSPIINGRVLFNSIPNGYPIPGETTVYDTTQTIDVETHSLDGGFLVKTLVLSIDPYQRGRMRSPEKESYVAAFKIGQPITGFGVGVVLRSENTEVAPGKYVYGAEFHSVAPQLMGFEFLEKNPDLPWTVYVGAAGMPGAKSLPPLFNQEANNGETAFVTTGAGPLAKRDGLKVIASAGSEEKVQFMKDIGADVAFNYKTTNTREVLAREGPIDIYWDNVAGEVLDAALENAAVYGRFIECGMISEYQAGRRQVLDAQRSRGLSSHEIQRRVLCDSALRTPNGELKYLEDVSYGLDKVGDFCSRCRRERTRGRRW
ncbi:chaperonin 10-like protein [Mycena rosella]|uniref:Chaperonin 10-like protein n=1 Tax=Mycena rosella TaxID=1033263 RepID=A0AAD7DIT3_MYCRO|nr:chaperonin 10-like protein [Mycena rosella]